MPMGSWLPMHPSCIRWLVVVALLFMALRWSEPKMGGEGFADYPMNKHEVNPPDQEVSAGEVDAGAAVHTISLGHQGDGEGGQKNGALLRSTRQGARATQVLWSYPAVDVRRRWQSCRCFIWSSKGDPPQPCSAGCSSSYVEDLQLRLEISQRCWPKWFVPGAGIAAPVAEFVVALRWRMTVRT